MKPKISIIMPVLDGQRYIGEAIRSIVAQTYRNYELIVVDDGSTDDTRDQVERFRDQIDLKVVRHVERMGVPRSVNDGLRETTGAFVAFLDHDDAYMPSFLETQLSYLEQHQDIAMVHSDFQTIDGDGKILEESVAASRSRSRPSGWVFREAFLDSFIVGNSVLIRKECLERFGGFDERLRYADYHLWMRMARHYKVDYVPKVLTQYRQHASQHSRNVQSAPTDQESVAIQSIRLILDEYPEVKKELGDKIVRRRLGRLYADLAYSWFFVGDFGAARRWLRQAIRLWPTNLNYHYFYLKSLLQPDLRSVSQLPKSDAILK